MFDLYKNPAYTIVTDSQTWYLGCRCSPYRELEGVDVLARVSKI